MRVIATAAFVPTVQVLGLGTVGSFGSISVPMFDMGMTVRPSTNTDAVRKRPLMTGVGSSGCTRRRLRGASSRRREPSSPRERLAGRSLLSPESLLSMGAVDSAKVLLDPGLSAPGAAKDTPDLRADPLADRPMKARLGVSDAAWCPGKFPP
jgi:hypothetical protein